MNRVTGYKTSDGQFHSNRRDARKHELVLVGEQIESLTSYLGNICNSENLKGFQIYALKLEHAYGLLRRLLREECRYMLNRSSAENLHPAWEHDEAPPLFDRNA